uniref:Uncharacterized protein n=1 Tax=Aegilops tauschii subsp. strangulata TaxID=200361 RepID=A0A453SH58_AEGTS
MVLSFPMEFVPPRIDLDRHLLNAAPFIVTESGIHAVPPSNTLYGT